MQWRQPNEETPWRASVRGGLWNPHCSHQRELKKLFPSVRKKMITGVRLGSQREVIQKISLLGQTPRGAVKMSFTLLSTSFISSIILA